MSTNFFTNNDGNTLLEKFKGIFQNHTDIECFDALVGYFKASGYFALRSYLANVPQIRILVGIEVDKLLAHFHAKGLMFQGDATQTIKEFLADIRKDIQESDYRRDVEAGIIQFIEDIVTKKIEIKAHPSRRLHAKIYIFRPKNWNNHNEGYIITGSSNLSEAGLGNGEITNYEFNVILHRFDDVEFATNEFEALWREGIPVLPVEIEKVKKETYLNDNYTPYEVYIKFLIEYFGNSVEFDPNSIADLPQGFKKLSYQIDAVNEGYKLMMKHNGFFLSDVVGLGKTVVAALIAKQFFYTNDFPSHITNTLIVIPPALWDNWSETLESFGLQNYKIITNGSLHKITNQEKYDLVIIDEAHKFRNDTAEAYNDLQKICKTKTRRILKDGFTKADKKVILMSATPLNNRPEDYQKEKLPDGKEIMALAEQAYIAYSKHLLLERQPDGSNVFDRTSAESFLPKLEELGNKYPSYQYPAYFQAKLLLSLGDRDNMLSALIPFARKKRNDFWVWEILSEAYLNDEDKVFALYCRALSCQSPEEMLINLRQKMAALLIKRQLFNEARTEIELLVSTRIAKDFRIPQIVSDWQSQEWYKNANALKNNKILYNQFKNIADGILFADIPEVTIIVEFVNSNKKILNFIESETNHGFFKYERFLKNVSIGEVLKVRFQSGTPGGLFLVYTVTKTENEDFRKQFYKEVNGVVRISSGKSFGFLDDVFIHPVFIAKHKISNGDFLKANALKTFNEAKKQWGWKLVELINAIK